ncbi:MAG: hypothetical protein HY701_10435 [Gemmatimonadetes bacterium]|nr:hypothetical protein [Gemmatimonadota bacterium]
MSFADDLARRVSAVAADRDRGATELAREALDVLCWTVEQGRLDHLPEAAAALGRARPTMAAIGNVVRRVVEDPSSAAGVAGAGDACRRARVWLEEASRAAVACAATLIPPDAAVMTCSYSSAVLQACLAARERRLRVLALESRAGRVAYGDRVAAFLRQHGVTCEVVPDDRLVGVVGASTFVLVGADRVVPDGALVNGSPSLRLARAAHDCGVRFYAVCEAFKLDEARSMAPGFDLVPPRLVTAYATAHGVLRPTEVWTVHQQRV